MNDFFTSLVNRSFQRAPVLQRRRPNVFEAVANREMLDGAPSPLEPIVREESAVESIQRSSGEPSVSNQFPFPSPFHQRVPSRKSKFNPFRNESPRVVASDISERLATASHHLHPQPSARQFEDASSGKPRLKPSSLEPSSRVFETNTERERLIETIVEKRAEKSTQSEPSKGGNERARIENHVEPSSPIRNLSKKDQQVEVNEKIKGKTVNPIKNQTPTNIIRLQPLVRPLPTPASRAVSRSPATLPKTEPAPPTIQVTIGRIEVRATPSAPSTTSPGSRPSAAKLSLEEYLRSRGKGKG